MLCTGGEQAVRGVAVLVLCAFAGTMLAGSSGSAPAGASVTTGDSAPAFVPEAAPDSSASAIHDDLASPDGERDRGMWGWVKRHPRTVLVVTAAVVAIGACILWCGDDSEADVAPLPDFPPPPGP
jgi:hypothetical protein